MPARRFVLIVLLGLMACGRDARGQDAAPDAPRAPSPEAAAAKDPAQDWPDKLDQAVRELKGLTQAQEKPGAESETERLRKQVELQQKQIDLLLQMTQMLANQVKKQGPAKGDLEDLQERVATEEARSQLAAQRDQMLSRAADQLAETVDAQSRDPRTLLPPTARELFDPTRTNESPLALYGTVAQNFTYQSGLPSTFRDQVIMLRPYIMFNERWMFAGNVALQIGNVQIWRAQLERYVNDYLTIVAGRFYSPLGFYSERLRENWVIRTPDPPLMFNQVYPQQLSFDGVQVRGAAYVPNTPVKLEYAGFLANGLTLSSGGATPVIYSNLGNLSDTTNDLNNVKAYGGRAGLSIPTIGVIGGISGYQNGSYDQAHHGLSLWDVDASWHRGNWDVRFETANTAQQAPRGAIHREGMYFQVAYRQYNCPNPILQRLEGVFRFDHVQFDGINVAQTGINFGGLGSAYMRQPLDRNRYTIGANYWFGPSLALKVAYEIRDELGTPSLRDNAFLAQLVWGW